MLVSRLRARLAPRTRLKQLRYRRFLRRLAGRRLLRAFADACPDAVFVEIGANDGVKDDHLRPYILGGRWTGVMVEPVPYVFEKLRANYAGRDGVRFENAAIAETDGTMPFFHLGEGAAGEDPHWYDEIGSFSRETVLQHARQVPALEERLAETEVPVLTFTSLCERHALDRVDIVVIDTEGYDGRLVRAFPFDRFRPRVLVYEHFHLSRTERTGTRAHLHSHGYETLEEGMDTFCLDTQPDDALTKKWRRLRPAAPGVAKEDEAPA